MAAQVSKPAHGSQEWLELRHRDQYGRVRFGASEAPTLMGANPFEELADLAIRKWSDPEVLPPNAAMERGNYLEPALVTYAADLLGQPVVTPDVMWTVGRFIATLDGLTADGKTIVECKTTVSYSSDDPIPDSYYWQACAQLGCVPDAERVVVVVLDKRMRFGTWEVRRSDDIDRLFDRAEQVGDMLDLKKLPSDAKLTEKHVKQLHPYADAGSQIELGSDGLFMYEAWTAWKHAREEAEREEQAARDRLVALLGPNEAGTVDGHVVVTYKTRKGSSTVDWKALTASLPKGTVDKFRREGTPTRVLKQVGE